MAGNISPHRCFVVATYGFMLSLGRPDEIYYDGDSDEQVASARARAQADADERQAAHPGLSFSVLTLDDYMDEMISDARATGERDASRY